MTSVQDYSCIFCQESFDDKETLQIHFRKHGDPKFNQTAKARLRVQNESPTSLETPKDDNETVSCDVCDEVFPTISKAITHKHKVHPEHDAKYFCPWCGKLFTLKHLYNKHLQSTHDSDASKTITSFHCDCCNVDFFVPSAMVYHNKFFHRQDTDIPALGHSKKVKLVSQELVQIFYCPFCGEEYNNRINLHKHMTDDHSDEDNSPENILRCPLCEAVFYHLDAYELHLTFHSSEDLYSEENEMLKQIVEFSLDTVPPLMEKMENPANDDDGEDMGAMGVDQFLQLTMNKDPEENHSEYMDKTKSKKHKKHKKSKKTITLDEFLNMNTDVFGEGLNVHGIEEVPTRIVTKQLKPKKESVRNNQKKVSSSDIDKLKKQGITIKMKSGKGLPNKLSQQPSTSSISKAKPIKSNIISTSSEVLSKLMNQSNSQVKIVKRSSPTNANMEFDSKEININKEPNILEDSTAFVEEKVSNDPVESKGIDYQNDINKSKNEIDSETHIDFVLDAKSKKIEEICHNSPDSTCPTQSEISCPNDDTLKDNTLDECNDKRQNLNINRDFHDAEIINSINEVDAEQALNDSEEGLASTKIQRGNITDTTKESQLNEVNEENVENKDDSSQDVTTNTLSAIKHLSGLITVKSVVNHATTSKEDDILNLSNHNNVEDPLDKDEKIFENNETSAVNVCKSENQKESTSRTLDALKNLSKHVTIKSLSSQVSSPPSSEVAKKSREGSDDEETINEEEDTELPIKGLKTNVVGRKVVKLKNQIKPSIVTNNSQVVNAAQISITKKSQDDETASETFDENVKNPSNSDLLKRLTNVTAKPIPSNRHLKREQNYFQTSKQSFSTNNILKQEKVNEEIEIFNIDDSDSDGQEKPDNTREVKTSKPPINPINKISNPAPKSNEALRNLSKQITVKPKDQLSKRINQSSLMEEETLFEHNTSFSDEDEDFDNVCNKMDNDMNQFMNRNNKILESTLKNLGKHITVKPKNMTQNILHRKYLERNTEQSEINFENNSECDSDSKRNKIKITEITDNAPSDHEFLSEEDEKNNKSYITQSPDASNNGTGDDYSEDEHFDKNSDIESNTSQTIATIKSGERTYSPASFSLSKESQKRPLNNTFKKINNEITIKSLKDTQIVKETESDFRSNTDNYNNNSKESSVKSFRQSVPKTSTKPENATMSSQVHRDQATTSNQVNSVNKEVSVKTFQSQTVIEEITTTVTKTIRTVKQEVQSASQTNTIPTFKSQKVLNYNRQGKNTQNITVRHPSPNIGTKIKNTAHPNKPATSGIRPLNQLVPVRHGLNLSKPNPNTPTVKNVNPKQIQQKPTTSRPLKISPQAMTQTVKRSSQESTSQFSGFKKPKDAQIRGEQDGEVSMHLSTSQSRSDFTSTVKNIKGRSLVTATQMKSEVNTSSHLSKLGNVSGLKVVKTTSKQATQVEERIENYGAKRTMEALQKLQMQGLLVKRPRTDGDNITQNDNDFSNSESENEEDLSDK